MKISQNNDRAVNVSNLGMPDCPPEWREQETMLLLNLVKRAVSFPAAHFC